MVRSANLLGSGSEPRQLTKTEPVVFLRSTTGYKLLSFQDTDAITEHQRVALLRPPAGGALLRLSVSLFREHSRRSRYDYHVARPHGILAETRMNATVHASPRRLSTWDGGQCKDAIITIAPR